MLSLFTRSLDNRAARTAVCHLTKRNEQSTVWRAHHLLFALLLVALSAKMVDAATPLSRYRENIRQAVIQLTTLEQWAKANSPAQHAARVASTFNNIRNAVPVDETIEWEGGTVRVNNSWLEAEFQAYEKMSPYDSRRADTLARITERMRALEDRLTELDSQRKIAVESKAKDKARLEAILRRDEFVEKPPQENALARMWRQFLEWWNNLFPRGSGLAPGQTSWLSLIALIVVFGLAAGLLGYATWKLVPFFERRRAKFKLEKREARVILGEHIAPDQSAADILRDAEALARRGELRAAIRLAYIAILCELGERKMLTLAQNKTNHDYLRALREKRPLLDEMQKLTNSFENHWYGFQQATAEDWTSFRTGYEKVISDE